VLVEHYFQVIERVIERLNSHAAKTQTPISSREQSRAPYIRPVTTKISSTMSTRPRPPLG
jgi:hypothetical protein